MTNSLIPYSFTPGTKAKAQEVNANFIALAEKIESNAETIAANKSSAAEDTAKCVHKEGIETVSGVKTFLGSSTTQAPIIMRHGDANLASPPSISSNVVFDMQDSEGARVGALYNTILSDGAVQTSIQAIRGSVYNTLGMHISNSGHSSLSVNGNVVRYVKYTYNNGPTWCRLWSDGWLEQGGALYDISGEGSVLTITFPRPFYDLGYGVFILRGGFFQRNERTDMGITGMAVTHCTIGINAGSNGYGRWFACGLDSTLA